MPPNHESLNERVASLETMGDVNSNEMTKQSADLKQIVESTNKIEVGMAIIAQKLDNLATHETRITALENESIGRKASFKTITFFGSVCGAILGYLSCYFSRGSK